MLKMIRAIFAKNKLKKIRNKIDKLYIQSVEYQRNGKLREYAQTLTDINNLEEVYARQQAELGK